MDEAVRKVLTGGWLPAPRLAPESRNAVVSALTWGPLPGTHLAAVCLEQSKLLNLTVLDVSSQVGRSHWRDEEAAPFRLQTAPISFLLFVFIYIACGTGGREKRGE